MSDAPVPFSPVRFFLQKGVFRREEFFEAHQASGRSRTTSEALLKYHLKKGRLYSLRRGLYGLAGGFFDPWAVGSKLNPDAVVAYLGAASFHNLLPTAYAMQILSAHRLPYFTYGDIIYSRVYAKAPRTEEQVLTIDRGHNRIHVTSKERTLVDLLDRIDLTDGVRSLWGAFVAAGELDVTLLIQRVNQLRGRLLAGRLGLFLQHLGPQYLAAAKAFSPFRPRTPVYFDPVTRENQKQEEDFLVHRWCLHLPLALFIEMRRHFDP